MMAFRFSVLLQLSSCTYVYNYFSENARIKFIPIDADVSGVGMDWLGVKRVTEPNRTEPTDYTGRSRSTDGAYENFRLLRYRVLPPSPNRTQRMRYLLLILSLFLFQFIKLITYDSRFCLFKYHLLYLGS